MKSPYLKRLKTILMAISSGLIVLVGFDVYEVTVKYGTDWIVRPVVLSQLRSYHFV